MNAPTPWLVEILFLFSSSISIFYRILTAAPLLAFIYLICLFAYAIGYIKLRPPEPIMFHSPLCIFNLFIFCTLLLGKFAFANAQNSTSVTTTFTTFRPIFTVPAFADVGMYSYFLTNNSRPPSLLANNFDTLYTLPSTCRLTRTQGNQHRRRITDFELWSF